MSARRGILQKMRSLIYNRRGQSTMEYILILVIAVMLAMKFRSTILNKMSTLTDKLGQQMDQVTQPEN